MFGKGSKQAAELKIAKSFDTYEVKSSLTGEWLTLALSRFEQSYTSRHDRREWDYPSALGVVHLDYRMDVAIPVQLTLLEDEAPERGKVGVAHYNSVNGDQGDTEMIVLEVTLKDAGGKLARALQDAFTSAALSEERFVHLILKRSKLNPADLIPELVEKRYGAYHDLHEVQIRRRTQLPKTPSWSWRWKRDF